MWNSDLSAGTHTHSQAEVFTWHHFMNTHTDVSLLWYWAENLNSDPWLKTHTCRAPYVRTECVKTGQVSPSQVLNKGLRSCSFSPWQISADVKISCNTTCAWKVSAAVSNSFCHISHIFLLFNAWNCTHACLQQWWHSRMFPRGTERRKIKL